MSIWNNKTIPFWQDIKYFPNKFTIIGFLNSDPRTNWPESFQPSVNEIINKLHLVKTSYVKIKDDGEVYFINILAEKVIVSCTLFKNKSELILNKKNGFQYATNYLKTRFIKDGIKIEHDGIKIFDGKRDFYNEYNESHNENLKNDIENLLLYAKNISSKKIINQDTNEDEDVFTESESSKIEEILETLEAYVNKEYEIEDAKARAEKPFVYTEFKAEDIASTYKYYYRISLLKEDIKRLRELNPSMLQIKKTDETFMDLEVFNIKPDNSPNDIVVTTSFQTDRSMIDSSNELYLVAIPTLQKVRQRVIDDLRGKVSPNKWLVPLAAGVYKFKKTIKESVPEYNNERPLLPAQKDGVDKGAGSEDITLVLGPPGTGKTTVILSWVKYFVAQGKKVLVTSQSNMAVDNVLIRLDEEKEFECLRVGNESKVMREAHGLLLENYALNAQAKLVESLSDVMKSLQSSKTYLSTLNSSLRELLQYNAKEVKFTSEISNYKKSINDQNSKVKTTTSTISNLKNDNNFLEELINALKHHQSITTIQNKLSSKKEELESNEKRKNLLNEQLNKNSSKLDNLKKELSEAKQKVDSYPSRSTIAKVFMYLPNQKNIHKIESLTHDITSVEKIIISSKQEIENIITLKSTLHEDIEKIIAELSLLISNVPTFGHNLSTQNCEAKYEEFFKKQTILNKIGLVAGENLESRIEHSQNILVENSNKINELNELLNKDYEQLNKFNSQLEDVNQRYLDFTQSKPKIPEFVPCQYIDDKIYKSFYPSDEMCNRLISQTTTDLNFYNSLIEIVSVWERSMHSERQSSLYETILEYVDVVGATCIGINSNKLFANIPFDVVIVDESGQIQLHNLMVPLSRASKAILVGDHKQLPPVVDDELAAELEEQGFDPIFLQKSWFEILWDPMPNDHKTMLDTQFRCPAIISDFVSKAFYENKYFAGSGMEKKQPILPYFNSTMTFIDTSKVFPSYEQYKRSGGRLEVTGNKVETEIIIKTLERFIEKLPYLATDNELGIIVPYKNHVNEVKKQLRARKLNLGNLVIDDLVASVDSYQGQERDVIIFAFSRSNKGGNIGFLADWRRLNVAMTRTKKQLIMVGSLKTLTMDNQKEHEAEFKQAMRILESELRAKDSIIDGRKFVSGAKK